MNQAVDVQHISDIFIWIIDKAKQCVISPNNA